MTMTMNMIEIKNLDFNYRSGKVDVSIFKSFSLDVRQGQFIAIKGASGSGKSTLLYLIAGLLQFKRGSVSVKGHNVDKLSDIDLSLLRNKDMGFVFQQFHLLQKTSVLDNILLPSFYPVEEKKITANGRQRAEAIATELGIGDRLDHHPNQLSGGQQQRVAIARALINDPDIILADEPTGNLDSKSTSQIIQILKNLHAKGKTIVLITHEDEVAAAAEKVYTLKDGRIIDESINSASHSRPKIANATPIPTRMELSPLRKNLKLLPLAFSNAFRNKTRSILTMLGITVGVAAVCSMITLGNFTKEKILDSYADLGVNTIMFRGHQNWRLKAKDEYPLKFQGFDWNKELLPLKSIFSDINLLSPVMSNWGITASFAGKSIEDDVRLSGVSEDGLHILDRRLIAGKGISQLHLDRKIAVCVIGFEIGTQLFRNINPIGQIIHVAQDSSSFACRVIGVLESKTSNKEWAKPNLQIFLPFPVFQTANQRWWRAHINRVAIQLRKGSDSEKVGQALRSFFERKYGKSGQFRVSSDSILVAQMKKFLNLFSILLVSIALVSLTVGGMGIANMMLVSVSERLKEIGIRKSVGATHASIRQQFLLESLLLCTLAGVIGIIIGVAVYQGAIYGASRLIDKLQFEWVFEPSAILLSLISIASVGILSGLAPAIKAERLQVIDALRSE